MRFIFRVSVADPNDFCSDPDPEQDKDPGSGSGFGSGSGSLVKEI